jgi:phenylpropionate dioxygenase-like ring-hydroxylating dioxygenase large terminal subunit
MVWACLGDSEAAPDPVGPAVEDGVDAFFLQDVVECTLEAAAENFLDGTHTHFVHSGWIRRDRHRQAVRATVTILEDGGVQARYTGEGRQSGAISRFLEPDRLESMGRFRLPGIAEIEYRGRKGLNLLVTAWLVPESDGRLRVFARVATPKGFLPAWLKRFAARWLFGVILRQDASILESTGRNIAAFRGTGNERTFLDGPLDLLGPSIRRLLRGQPAEATAERTLDLHL